MLPHLLRGCMLVKEGCGRNGLEEIDGKSGFLYSDPTMQCKGYFFLSYLNRLLHIKLNLQEEQPSL